jgi:large subunit ribosomal protein L13
LDKQTKPKKETKAPVADNLYVIDAADMLVGRLATQAARAALHGYKVRVINAEKAVVSGSKSFLVQEWRRRFLQGVPRKGPYIHRYPDRMVRRIIRGMLPHHQPRGRVAFANTMCYIGVPTELKEHKAIKIEGASVSKLPLTKYMTIAQLCKEIGGKWHEQ